MLFFSSSKSLCFHNDVVGGMGLLSNAQRKLIGCSPTSKYWDLNHKPRLRAQESSGAACDLQTRRRAEQERGLRPAGPPLRPHPVTGFSRCVLLTPVYFGAPLRAKHFIYFFLIFLSHNPLFYSENTHKAARFWNGQDESSIFQMKQK